MTRDEPLFFNASVFKQGKKGERFWVAEHRIQEKRVYVFSKDASDQTIALNISEQAVEVYGIKISMLTEAAFFALETADLSTVHECLNKLKNRPEYYTAFIPISNVLNQLEVAWKEYQAFAQNKPKAVAEINKRKRDLDRMNVPNPLTGNASSPKIIAFKQEMVQLEEDLRELESARVTAVTEGIQDLFRKAAELRFSRAYLEAYCVARCAGALADNVRKAGGEAFRYLHTPSIGPYEDFEGGISGAKLRLKEIRSDLRDGRVIEARDAIFKRLKIESGSVILGHILKEIGKVSEAASNQDAQAVSKETPKLPSEVQNNANEVQNNPKSPRLSVGAEPSDLLSKGIIISFAAFLVMVAVWLGKRS